MLACTKHRIEATLDLRLTYHRRVDPPLKARGLHINHACARQGALTGNTPVSPSMFEIFIKSRIQQDILMAPGGHGKPSCDEARRSVGPTALQALLCRRFCKAHNLSESTYTVNSKCKLNLPSGRSSSSNIMHRTLVRSSVENVRSLNVPCISREMPWPCLLDMSIKCGLQSFRAI